MGNTEPTPPVTDPTTDAPPEGIAPLAPDDPGGEQVGDTGGSADSKRGYPANTPLAEMTVEQKLAYWTAQSRKHEDTAKTIKRTSTSSEDAQKLRDRIAELENEKLTEDERKTADAIEIARKEALETARAELLPQLREAQMRSYASIVLDGKKLDAFMSTVNPQVFVGEDGQLDGDKVVTYLTDLFGGEKTPASGAARHPNWGQGGQGAPPKKEKRGESGRTEAARRFGSKDKTE